MKKQGKRWLSILLAGALALLAPAALAIQGDTAGEGSTEYIEVEACPGHLLGSVNGLPACVNAAGDLHVCENNFPDRNFKTIIVRQLYGEEAFGIEYFTKEDLEDRTILNVEIYSIRSLQGIGYFPNLKDLNCAGNWMKKLDLSHNPRLERLRCQNNRLETLDVSVLPNLTYLDCGENELTALDVSGNPLLETLCCDFNSLTELHVECLPNLSYLDCHMNLLTELDVGYNAELTDLYCQSNRLTALDVSGNPKLTNLRCYENQLTGLDLSYNTQLKEENVSLRQTLFAQSVATDSGWEVHLSAYLPPESLERVLSVSAGTYDAVSGTVSFDRKPSAFQVTVATGREGLDMPIDFAPVEEGTFGGLPACVTAAGDLHICENNFPDETFRLFLLDSLDGHDGFFTKWEIEDITDLQVVQMGIQSLEGIGYFYNLTVLSCYENQITSLDVSGNSQLKSLYCYNNQLTELHIGDNSKISSLSCNGNQLTQLYLQGAPLLYRLDCSNNPLTTLDISGNPRMEFLYCDSCGLTKLDVSHNPALYTLKCDGNYGLTTLDVSSNPKLAELSCVGNALTALDISGNPELESLSCEYNQLTSLKLDNPALTYLNCGTNQLAGLDVSGAPALETLYCDFNGMMSLNIQKNPALVTLDCGDNALPALDVSGSPGLETLSCYHNRLTALDVSGNPALRDLLCQGNRLTGLNLSGNPMLETLCCDGNRLAALDLRGNPNLTDCVLSTQAIRAESRQVDGRWEVDLSGYIPAEMRGQVLSVSSGSYDPTAGKVYFDAEPGAFRYAVATGRDGLDMAVDVDLGKDLLPGDLDGNGAVDIQDVMAACKILARQNGGSQPTADEIARGDLTGDGYIQIDDIMAICKILAEKA